jgi:acylpyruvate hydrolase
MRLFKFLAEGEASWGYLDSGDIVEIDAGEGGKRYHLEEVKVLAPFFGTKIICLGLNYMSHAEENRAELPDKPILFSKATSALIGDGEPVIKPEAVKRLDYEVELAFVMSKRAKKVKRDWYDYILGYTIVNDVSARDLQFSEVQWFRSKSGDTFCPMGPCIVGKEEIVDPMDLVLEMRVNGEIRQKSKTSEMIFDIPHIVEFITEVVTLMPGDVVATGTPAGVGAFRDPPIFLEDGDLMEARIEGIGELKNRVSFGYALPYGPS